jgi:hypothetical protein
VCKYPEKTARRKLVLSLSEYTRPPWENDELGFRYEDENEWDEKFEDEKENWDLVQDQNRDVPGSSTRPSTDIGWTSASAAGLIKASNVNYGLGPGAGVKRGSFEAGSEIGVPAKRGKVGAGVWMPRILGECYSILCGVFG